MESELKIAHQKECKSRGDGGFPKQPPRLECVTGTGTDRRRRKEPHAGRHLHGCRQIYPCGCEKMYYSAFFYKHGARFAFHDPDRSFMDVTRDGRCPKHFAEYCNVVTA